MRDQIDMLLLNCSNLPWRPIFPYAFVQVSEISRRFDLVIERVDMLRISNWAEYIKNIIKVKKPKSIGIHLRQGDSIDLSDYYTKGAPKNEFFRSYYPIEDSKKLIDIVRKHSDAPIILGGFGFTTHAKKLANHLEIDLGMQGCPDGLFANFEDVLRGNNLSNVPGLVHHNGSDYIFNQQNFYNPATNMEYNDQIVDELKFFYGDMLKSNNPPTIAVEISRGCPFQCYFCTEPDVKGKRVNHRDQDVVIAEMEYLLTRNLQDFWFICSEINIGGTKYILELAEKVIRLSEKFKGNSIRWSGYCLPTLEFDELATLQRAGYSGAMNDILSLDDKNLKEAQVPYKKTQAVSFLKSMIKLREDISSESDGEIDENTKFTASTPSQYSGLISFFFGNSHINENTIANTLEELNNHDMTGYYDEGYVIPSSRVFSIGRTTEFVNKNGTISISDKGIVDRDTLLPTFYFPDFLMKKLETRENILAFFDYVTTTFMSKKHTKSRNFLEILKPYQHISYIKVILEKATQQNIQQVIAKQQPSTNNSSDKSDPLITSETNTLLDSTRNSLIQNELRMLFNESRDKLRNIISTLGSHMFLGTEITVSEYTFTKNVYKQYNSIEHMKKALLKDNHNLGIQHIFVDYIIHTCNIKIENNYKDLLFN